MAGTERRTTMDVQTKETTETFYVVEGPESPKICVKTTKNDNGLRVEIGRKNDTGQFAKINSLTGYGEMSELSSVLSAVLEENGNGNQQ